VKHYTVSFLRPRLAAELVPVFLVAAIGGASAQSTTLDAAQRLFYNGRYEDAAALTRDLCFAEPADLAACELRSSALLFQIKRAFGEPSDKAKAFKQCAICQTLMPIFLAETARAQAVARTRLQAHPADDTTLFLLGKIDLNYVWLQLGTLGRKTGWGEYWEARRSLDSVLTRDPAHVRARVARAWMDYIVGTKVPRVTRWMLGGGDKKRGLLAVRDAANMEADVFVQAEAGFALWDMQVRERNITEAVVTARRLARSFPENEELTRFLKARDPSWLLNEAR
jgi:hypothetical protein